MSERKVGKFFRRLAVLLIQANTGRKSQCLFCSPNPFFHPAHVNLEFTCIRFPLDNPYTRPHRFTQNPDNGLKTVRI